jgi:hypothetical protein
MYMLIEYGFVAGGPGSLPGQSIWDLWWTERHREGISPHFSDAPLSVSFHRRSILTRGSPGDGQ